MACVEGMNFNDGVNRGDNSPFSPLDCGEGDSVDIPSL